MKDIKDYTTEELKAILNDRIKEDKENEILSQQKGLKELKTFLTGKEYIIDRPNPNYIQLYKLDKNYIPDIKEDSWVGCKPLSRLYLSMDNLDAYLKEIMFVSESITYSYEEFRYDGENNLLKRRQEDNLKYFHPNDIHSISEISKDEFDYILKTARNNTTNIFKITKHEYLK